MRLLVVEDYAPLRAAVVQALREEGHSVDEAADGRDGLARASTCDYDVVLLDIQLPGADGLAVLRRLRAAERPCAVLLMTARDGVDDRVAGLDLGADDYLVKPFAMQELLARVRALLRRGYDRPAPVLDIGPLRLDTARREVSVDGRDVTLTAREYGLLEYLALRAGQVVSRTAIWEHLYDDRSDATSNVVDVYVGYLRRKLGAPGLIVTRRGEGYVLADPGGAAR